MNEQQHLYFDQYGVFLSLRDRNPNELIEFIEKAMKILKCSCQELLLSVKIWLGIFLGFRMYGLHSLHLYSLFWMETFSFSFLFLLLLSFKGVYCCSVQFIGISEYQSSFPFKYLPHLSGPSLIFSLFL